MRFRITTFAQDGARITQQEAEAVSLDDCVISILPDGHFLQIDADATRLTIDELGEDGEPVTKGEG